MTLDRWRRTLRLRLRSLFFARAVDRELAEELQHHIDLQIDANIARGMPPDAARTAALRAFGGLEQRKEQCRDTRGVGMLENLARDVSLAFRHVRKQPAFTLTAVLSLALGIGANSAIFQLLNALSLRRLPVAAPHELVDVRLTGPGRAGRHTGRNRQVSLPQYQALARRQQAFTSMLAFSDTRFNVSPQGEVRYVDGMWVSGNFFDTLGVRPLLGRLIAPEDDTPGCGAGVAVISHSLWQSEYGGRSDIIGQTVPTPVAHIPIVGVTPRDFFGVEVGREYGIALPICASGNTRRDHWWLAAIGRLKPGWTQAQALSHVQGLLPDVQQETLPEFRADYAREYLRMGVEIVDASTGVSPLRATYQQPLWILLAIATVVLLIASVNLANLLLAQATARQSEFALRLALGGSRRRLLQQVLVESLVIAALGSLAALMVAVAAGASIPPLISTTVDRIYLDVGIDWHVFGFTALAGIVTALLFGAAPAVRAARTPMLGASTRGGAANSGLALRRVLVGAQIAFTLVLLFAGLLFLRTFRNLATLETGVDAAGVLEANVFLSESRYPSQTRRHAMQALDDRLRAVPGVTSLAEAFMTPLGGSFRDTSIVVGGTNVGESNVNEVSANYFATLGTRLVAGRDFDARDTVGSQRVALVNEAFVADFFTGSSIGQRFTIPDDRSGPGTEFEVIGVVANQKYLDLRERSPRILYTASAQNPAPGLTRRYVIRSTSPMPELTRAVSAALATADPSLSVRYSALQTQFGEALLRERLMARLSALFGVVALVLAITGLYGVVSYTVARRRGEIGVRMALGATQPQIFAMILGDVLRMLAVGVASGGMLAVFASRAIGTLLYGVAPSDPVTLMAAALILGIASLISAAVPARIAAGVDPLCTLREP